MNDLALHIEYLLMSHDCVVVPGLGAFLVHESPAYHDAEAGRFMPPSRSLGFNQAITLNDGLLSESVARRRGVSLDAARTEVENAVSAFRHQLMSVHTLPVGNLGVMSTEEDTLIFEPSAESVVTMRYAGLRPLTVTPLADESAAQGVDEPTVIETPSRRDGFVPLSLKIAASIIIIMVMCGVFYTTDSLMGRRQTNYASLDSGLRSQVECPAVVEGESLAISREIELNIAAPRADEAVEAQACATVEATTDTAVPAAPGRYLLVVASFPSMKSAIRHIGDDSRLSVLEMDGNYRVYAASTKTNAEAHAKADELRGEFPSVWICRR